MHDRITTDDIEILDFIFHIVHHGEDQPILMDSTPVGAFDFFFKARILEILEGNKFDFSLPSNFLDSISSIKDNESQENFLRTSKQLAIDLHSRRDNRIKPGVMILIRADIQGRKKCILIKYDNENVLTYSQVDKKAILEEISNTFSKSKEALQKSAVVDLEDPNPFVLIIDKSDRKHVTQFFKGFLGVIRRYDTKKLTDLVKNSYLSTVKKHKDDLPSEYTSSASSRYYDLVQITTSFEKETFLQAIFGQYYLPEMATTFEKEMKSNDISGEEFEFDKSIKKPQQRKLRTLEGVTIQFNIDASDTVDINTQNAQKTVITIETSKLIEENAPISSSSRNINN